MPADIYGANPASNRSRRKHQAVSQRRDEYLRATGGEAVHQRHRHHHHQHQHQHRERHRRFPRWKAVLLGLGLLVLAVAGLVWWRTGTP